MANSYNSEILGRALLFLLRLSLLLVSIAFASCVDGEIFLACPFSLVLTIFPSCFLFSVVVAWTRLIDRSFKFLKSRASSPAKFLDAFSSPTNPYREVSDSAPDRRSTSRALASCWFRLARSPPRKFLPRFLRKLFPDPLRLKLLLPLGLRLAS